MKKAVTISLFSLVSSFIFGQAITLSFSGQDSLSQAVLPLDSVLIRNITAGCDTTIYGSAPSVVLTNSLGINENISQYSRSFSVLPPWPNPSTGTTTVMVMVNVPCEIVLRLMDAGGIVLAQYGGMLPEGMHRFTIGSVENGLLLFSVTDGKVRCAVKLISQGNSAAGSVIRYLGRQPGDLKSSNLAGGFVFWFGNELAFISFATGYTSDPITNTPVHTSGYVFRLTPEGGYLPVVTTSDISAITLNSAKSGGNVTWEGSFPVIARGACFDSIPGPDLTDGFTVNGTGPGPYTSHLTGLTMNTVYYVRAYATNSAGTAFGEEVSFISGQQVENPGFEIWEEAITSVMEPVDWSSVKTCDNAGIGNLAPVTIERSSDAHTGSYSLKLFNVTIFNTAVTGAVTNGIFHADFNFDSSYAYTKVPDARWNTPFASRPDSLVGWFKYFPQGNDIAQVKMILHFGEGKIPENGTMPNWVAMAAFQTPAGAAYDTWTRFSVPFDYYSDELPEYLLCVISSSYAVSSMEGSYLLIDDLEVIYANF